MDIVQFQEWFTTNDDKQYIQEALLKLFGGLCIISKLNEFIPAHGNFNMSTFAKQLSYKEIFYKENGDKLNIKQGGDSSDFTMISKTNDKHLLAISSKCLTNEQSGKLDVEKMAFYAQKYVDMGYIVSYGFTVRDKANTDNMISRTHSSSKDLVNVYTRKDTIVVDWDDLFQAFHAFKMNFQNTLVDTIISSTKNALCFKLHQELAILRTLRMKDCNKKEILWGHIQRSGKSYIIAGCIIEDSKNKDKCNYLVITTAPKETTRQQASVFDCLQLRGFNVVKLNGKNKTPTLTDRNIILCSKQFLQNKFDKGHDTQKHTEIQTKNIPWLKNMRFDMRFIDESHNGGTTELAQKTLDYYGSNAFTIQITATYNKPANHFAIPKENWILWDSEDIKLCRTIHLDKSRERLIEKHGDDIGDIIDKYSVANIIDEYSKYPDLVLLTRELTRESVREIINETLENNYGWSQEACFLPKQCIEIDSVTGKNTIKILDEFQNEFENLKLWYSVFGKKSKFGTPDRDFPDDIVFMKRIEKICKNPEINSRFIGEGIMSNEPMIIMAFLPQNNIDEISKATIKLLVSNSVIPEYDIISINSKTTDDPKQSIEDARKRAKNSGKKGVLVLSGRQCSLAASIDNCDIVLLMNNSMSADMVSQMMYRSMTGGEGKKCGFVVDLNIHRAVQQTIMSYASFIRPNSHPKDAIKYILQERLINLNGDHWMASFGHDSQNITEICDHIYNVYVSSAETALKNLLDRLKYKKLVLSPEDQKMINNINLSIQTRRTENENDENNDEDENIKKGIEKVKVKTPSESKCTQESVASDTREEIETNYIDIIMHLVPLVCILTIHHNETGLIEMFHIIQCNQHIYDLFLNQFKVWGNNINSETIQTLINIYFKYMKNEQELDQIIRTIKELFMKNLNNKKKLSTLIDTYLEATDVEKMNNAEITTIFNLRQESLNRVPDNFWKTPKKVIEPSCGKGGYILDIIDKFMNGLKDMIPNETERYKTIVEECIYFSDINPTNIFICKLLIDPNNEYNLNYNEGNTLELDITKTTAHWKGLSKFDLHVCNPPYEDNVSGKRKALNHNLWSEFLNWSYQRLSEDGLLLYITPTSWMSPTFKYKNIFYENYILYLNVNECKKHFNVGSTFSYYLIQKTNKMGETHVDCEYNKQIYHSTCNLNGMEYLPNFVTSETINIIKKFRHNELQKVSFSTSCELHNTTHKAKLNDTKTGVFIYPVRHTTKRDIRYSSVQHSKQNEKKILLNLSGNLNPIYDDGTMGFTQAQMYLLTDQKGYVNILNSNIYKFVFTICKWSGFNIEKIFHNVPFIAENKNDDELYKIFNLTEDEVTFIKNCL